ncbi:MAG: hypothetical protein KQI35_07035 [Bacteroidetes bacterium]|nr:hypothetical protein [Bacteroidota bacterium]
MGQFKKQISSIFIVLLIILVILELSPFLMGRYFLGEGFSRSEIQKALLNQTDAVEDSTVKLGTDDGGYLGEHLLHPYLGFVSIPRAGYNQYGFPGPDPITQKDDQTLNICITGGSVAKQLYQFTKDRIKTNLQNHPAFKNKKIHIVLLALGGFKQPQQLLSVNYFMTLGAQYDIVINLDGFNEIVLPYSDNLPFGVFPSYPRHWNIYSRKRMDQKVILQLGKQAELKDRQEHARQRLAGSFLRHSNFILLLWKISDMNKHNQVLVSEAKLREIIEKQGTDYQSTGPEFTVRDTSNFFKQQALFWAQSSQQIAALSQTGNFQYFHFLQPNQYDEGSKPLTPEELEVAYEQGPFSYKDAARQGYPMLRTEGQKLQESGINFTDLSLLFKNETRTVYSDKCCHFNQLGYNSLADQIARKILEVQ